MTLAEWRETNGLSREWIGEALGISSVSVGRYERGERLPKRELIDAVYELTEGVVDANAWFGHRKGAA